MSNQIGSNIKKITKTIVINSQLEEFKKILKKIKSDFKKLKNNT
jgi:hypothetical protein|tara:strand:+ start:558 stop:689 length:132 start_codon:yes stop_codon:yes gene_type:complete